MMTKVRRTLGGGLEAVLNVGKRTLDDTPDRELKMLSVNQIKPGQYQPRREFNAEDLQSLSDSIKEQGVIQPIIVRAIGTEFEIIAGERRWRAAKMAGLSEIPAIISCIDDETALAFGLIENIQRKDLNPIEEAMALKRLIEEFDMTHEEVAKAVGRSRTMVTNMLRLLQLNDAVKELLIQKKIEMGHARALLALPENEQGHLAQKIVEQQLTVRLAENMVQRKKRTKEQKPLFYREELQDWTQQLSESLSSKVSVNINEQGEGRVVIHFTSPDEVDWLVKALNAIQFSRERELA